MNDPHPDTLATGASCDRTSMTTETSHKGESQTQSSSVARTESGESITVPVVEEELQVGKRVVEGGGVRVTRRIEAHEQLIEQALKREDVDVRRVPVQRVVNGEEPVRQDGDTIVIPIVEEVLVVRKQLVVREEIHIRKRVREEVVPQRVTLHKQIVEVENLQSNDTPGEGGTTIANRNTPTP